MEVQERSLEPIPSWALSSIINADDTGLEKEEVELIQEWFAETGYDYVYCPSDNQQPYFTNYPAFGKPCDVFDCYCVKF